MILDHLHLVVIKKKSLLTQQPPVIQVSRHEIQGTVTLNQTCFEKTNRAKNKSFGLQMSNYSKLNNSNNEMIFLKGCLIYTDFLNYIGK